MRREAREILQRAIEAKVGTLMESFHRVQLLDGRRAVVRSGNLPSRENLTGIGPAPVQGPKVRDRSGAGSSQRVVGPDVCAAPSPGVGGAAVVVPQGGLQWGPSRGSGGISRA